MFSQRIPKAIDALSTAGIAAVMQVLVIGPWLTARIQAARDPEALGYHFIGLGMVMFFFFCLSLTFFIMALVKYRAAIKEGALPQYKHIISVAKVLNFVVGICIAVQLYFAIHRILDIIISFK